MIQEKGLSRKGGEYGEDVELRTKLMVGGLRKGKKGGEGQTGG